MLKHVALAGFAVAIATSAQAMPRAPLQAESMITQVRQGCGIGMVLVGGQCVSRQDLRVQRRMDREYFGGAYAAAANPDGMCYRQWDQDARNTRMMPCSSGAAAYVDTPGVRAILRARETTGSGTWYPYAVSSGIICMPGTNITLGGQAYLCQ